MVRKTKKKLRVKVGKNKVIIVERKIFSCFSKKKTTHKLAVCLVISELSIKKYFMNQSGSVPEN